MSEDQGDHGMSHYDKIAACPFCRALVPDVAKKCARCGSDIKGIRKYFYFGTTMLALFTALISVISSSVPAVRWYLEPKDAQLHIHYFSTIDQDPSTLLSGNSVNAAISNVSERKSHILVFLASNDGTKSGAAVKFTLRITWLTNKLHAALFDANTTDSLPVIAEPGQSVPFELIIDDESPKFKDATNTDFQALEDSIIKYTLASENVHMSPQDSSASSEFHEDSFRSDRTLRLNCSMLIDTRDSSGMMQYIQCPISCEEVLFRIFHNCLPSNHLLTKQ